MDQGSVGAGFMAVFAVSGSIVFIAREVHKRLLSDFMKKIEYELGGTRSAAGKCHQEKIKRVRFAEDVMEPSSNNKEYRKRYEYKYNLQGKQQQEACKVMKMNDHSMPPNRLVLYKGILQNKTVETHYV